MGAVSFNGVPVSPEAVRTEFYAVGLRNAWRFSFDSKTGSLYCNDTSETTREEVNRIVKGGNYGWAHWEGSMIGPKWRPGMSKNDYKLPLIEYGRELGNDIAGGLLYRGDALPSLDGSYVFSDFWNGFLGQFYPNGNTAGKIEWLLYDSGISDIGIHPATGEILLADWFEGSVKRLVAKPDPVLPPLPQRLSGTGVFRNLEELLPGAGVVPYEINVPFWSNFAVKQRWFFPDAFQPKLFPAIAQQNPLSGGRRLDQAIQSKTKSRRPLTPFAASKLEFWCKPPLDFPTE